MVGLYGCCLQVLDMLVCCDSAGGVACSAMGSTLCSRLYPAGTAGVEGQTGGGGSQQGEGSGPQQGEGSGAEGAGQGAWHMQACLDPALHCLMVVWQAPGQGGQGKSEQEPAANERGGGASKRDGGLSEEGGEGAGRGPVCAALLTHEVLPARRQELLCVAEQAGRLGEMLERALGRSDCKAKLSQNRAKMAGNSQFIELCTLVHVMQTQLAALAYFWGQALSLNACFLHAHSSASPMHTPYVWHDFLLRTH